jgi:hypothetical protein
MIYTKHVKLNWKLIWLAILLLPMPFLISGCGGVNGSYTVTPATFFAPGLLRNDTKPATNAPCVLAPNTTVIASAN